MKNKVRYALVAFLPLQWILLKVLAHYPSLVEDYYTHGIYPYISRGFRYALGWIPFSFGDLLYCALIVMLVRGLYLLIKKRFANWRPLSLQLIAGFSLLYFAFHAAWGFNYYRLPLHQALEIEKDYTTDELVVLTQKLVQRANVLHAQLQQDDSLAVVFDFKKSALFKATPTGYDQLSATFPSLEYHPRSLKVSLLSYPLSITGFSGYLNPLTNEAQINGLIPKYRWPLVCSHEIAHQLGFAKENEANFIACLATMSHPDPYFQYSGTIFALRNCLGELYRRDQEQGRAARESMRYGIIANYQETQRFWSSFENPFEPFTKAFYSGYLKSNNQPEGMLSYNYVVALLVNYDKAHGQFP
ncbi:DUF3810 domain-containing protein [Croceiramulus getboli]|nr:DUF3810 domain-containing protein [Flavobacteriaceae bacterium YJPT1-3]